MAIASLVASVIGFVCGIGSIVGIVLGIVALNQIKVTGEQRPRSCHRGHRHRSRFAADQPDLDRRRTGILTVTSGPEQPFRGPESSPLENSPPSVDPYAPVDYPTDPGLPPPVYRHPDIRRPAIRSQRPATRRPVTRRAPPPDIRRRTRARIAYGTDPYDPYRATKPPGTNGKAIAALVTSLAGLVFCGLPSIVGLILGIIAMRETKRTGQDGHGLALGGRHRRRPGHRGLAALLRAHHRPRSPAAASTV